MRILIVTQYFWPENFRINDLVVGLEDRGYDVTVLTGKPNYPSGTFYSGYGFFRRGHEDYHGARIVRAPLLPRGKGGGFRLALNYLSFLLFATLLGSFRCRGAYDAIFVYEPSPITVALPALALKKIKHSPVILWVQDLWPESLEATGAVRAKWLLALVEKLVRFVYRGCDLILVQSRAFIRPIQALGVAGERIVYFPNSAEELYRPVKVEQTAPERMTLPQGFRVMFAGNIGKAQDFETIVSAADRLKAHKNIHWVILGDGRMLTWVQEQVRTRGLVDTVHLLGRHPIESMPRYFALADAMLVTLKKEPIFALTIPAKVQSYLACAKPLIAAVDGEGARVVQEARAGLTPPAEDPQALAEAVLAMYRMTAAERQEMGVQGRHYFEVHFERNKLLAQLEGWLKGASKQVDLCAS